MASRFRTKSAFRLGCCSPIVYSVVREIVPETKEDMVFNQGTRISSLFETVEIIKYIVSKPCVIEIDFRIFLDSVMGFLWNGWINRTMYVSWSIDRVLFVSL